MVLSWIEANVEFEKVQKMLPPKIELASQDMLDTTFVLIKRLLTKENFYALIQ